MPAAGCGPAPSAVPTVSTAASTLLIRCPGCSCSARAVRIGGRELRIERRAGTDRRPILRLEGCEDRTGAEGLGGQELLVARASAPELEADEWWAEDLEGCTVRDGETEVGTVTRLLSLPSCEVLEVARAPGGSPLLVPLVGDAVRSVDVAAREIEIDLRFLGRRTDAGAGS